MCNQVYISHYSASIIVSLYITIITCLFIRSNQDKKEQFKDGNKVNRGEDRDRISLWASLISVPGLYTESQNSTATHENHQEKQDVNLRKTLITTQSQIAERAWHDIQT